MIFEPLRLFKELRLLSYSQANEEQKILKKSVDFS